MHFARVADGGRIEFVIGCYTQVGGTGSVKWVQSAIVTLSASGDSYTASSAGSGSSGAQGSGSGSATGQQGSTSGQGQGVAATTTADSTGMSGGAEAALITGCCAVVLAIIGFVVYRRQDRSRLM
jgi:cobalamin biosynthesis Mg chelatase CobN